MNKNLIFVLAFLVMLFNSCSVGQKIIYVKDMPENTQIPVTNVKPMQVQKDDRLSISVSSKNIELAAPFNNEMAGYSVGVNGEVSPRGGNNTSGNSGYKVDENGNIEFPILGSLNVEGKSLEEVKNYIKNKLINEKYINDPIVKVDLINGKISILGEVAVKRVIDITDTKITLLEAIAHSNGLTRNAAADRVVVIREENGVRKKIVANIESQDVFNSPAYYLQQNDIVFVEPKDKESTPKEERGWRVTSILMSSVTIVLAVLTFLK